MTAIPRQWVQARMNWTIQQCPPDLTPSTADEDALCTSEHFGFGCTRLSGHTGRHAAGTGRYIVAVWL